MITYIVQRKSVYATSRSTGTLVHYSPDRGNALDSIGYTCKMEPYFLKKEGSVKSCASSLGEANDLVGTITAFVNLGNCKLALRNSWFNCLGDKLNWAVILFISAGLKTCNIVYKQNIDCHIYLIVAKYPSYGQIS